MVTGKFISDNLEPQVEEINMGDDIKQLVIKYKKDEPEHPKVLHVIQFLPRQTRTEEREFPWHDFLVYVITTAPIIATLVFAKELIMAHAFAPMGFASVLWFWFVFMVNTKLRGVFR